MNTPKYYKAQIYLLPFVLLAMLIIWLLSSCETTKYITTSNFHQLQKGMAEQAFLDWKKGDYVAVNGRPATVRMFNLNGDEWKVYVYELYRIDDLGAHFSHYEHAAFKNGRLEEYGHGTLPITLQQNRNSYEVTVKQR